MLRLLPSKSGSKKRKSKTVGKFSKSATAGSNKATLTKKIVKKLRVGTYTLQLIAKDAAGNSSKAKRGKFKVKK